MRLALITVGLHAERERGQGRDDRKARMRDLAAKPRMTNDAPQSAACASRICRSILEILCRR
jgi:hypothetical protein